MKRFRTASLIVLCLFVLALCAFASLAFGSRSIPIADVVYTLIHGSSDTLEQLVVQERIPRTVFGLLAGASLGVSGALMQAITRNPIADPSILGVNNGSSFFVICGIAYFGATTAIDYMWLALIGAALTSVFVYGIGSMGSGGSTPIKLALAGAATSAVLSSLVSAIMLPRTQAMNSFRFWQIGSLGGADWESIRLILPFLIIGMLLGVFSAPTLDALALGDELATGLGVRTGTARLISAIGGVLLCGSTTALAGPIGFVGLMIPHTVRLIFGPSLKIIIPMSAVGGAALLLVADVIGRLLGSPGELETGIVTAFVGAPVLIFIAMKAKVKSI